MQQFSLKVQPLSSEAFRPYGDVIEVDEGCTRFEINNGSCIRYHDLATIDVSAQMGHPLVSLFQAQPMPDDFLIKTMERHPLASQAFIPLSGQQYLVIVAKAGDFKLTEVEAFIAEANQGVNYARGTWHHYCLPLNKESTFLVIDRGGKGENCDEVYIEDDLECRVLLSS